MLNFNSFKLTALVAVCFLFSAFVWLKFFYPLQNTVFLVSTAFGYVGVLALKSLATALIVWVVSRKSISLPCALTIAIFTHFVHQVSSDAYLALTGAQL